MTTNKLIKALRRLEEKPWVDQSNTAARERYVRQSARFAKAGKRQLMWPRWYMDDGCIFAGMSGAALRAALLSPLRAVGTSLPKNTVRIAARKWMEVLTNEKASPAACAILLVRFPAEMDSPAGESIALLHVLLFGGKSSSKCVFCKIKGLSHKAHPVSR